VPTPLLLLAVVLVFAQASAGDPLPTARPSTLSARFSPQDGGWLQVFGPDGALVGSARTGRVVDLFFDGDVGVFLVTARRSSERGDRVVHLSIEKQARDTAETQGRLRWRFSRELPELQPWKIWLADVDGDGRRELALGVYKAARFDPVPRKRLFIYDWPGHDLVPRWLGSRLAFPFDDFAFVDCPGGDGSALFAAESEPGGGHRLMRYQWNGFGFSGDTRDAIELPQDSPLVETIAQGLLIQHATAAALCDKRSRP